MKLFTLSSLYTLALILGLLTCQSEAKISAISVPNVITAGQPFPLSFVAAPDGPGESTELFFAVVGLSAPSGKPSTLYNILDRINLVQQNLNHAQSNFSLDVRALDVPHSLAPKPVPMLIRVGIFQATGDDKVFSTLDLQAQTTLQARDM